MHRAVLHTAIEEIASARPDGIALTHAGAHLTYRALNRRANAVAARLRALDGFARGDIVGLMLPRGPELVTAMLAVSKAGGVFMPLDLDAPAPMLRAQLDKAKPRAILAAGAAPPVPSDGPGAPVIGVAGLTEEAEDPVPAAEGADGCYVVFTSGSTGTPKAILGTHEGLGHFVSWEVAEFGLGPYDRVSLLAPPTFDVCLRDVFAPLVAGGTLCIPGPGDDRVRLLGWLDESAVTLVHCVPSLFRALCDQMAADPEPRRRLGALKRVLLAGEPLYAADVARWRSLVGDGVELVNLYGPSETTLAKSFHRVAAVPADPGRTVPVGRPLPDTALLLIRDGELCDIGEIGEVHIRTPFMTRGYLGDAALTAEAFIQNPLVPDRADIVYRTGDLGRYGPDRGVELLGRRDGQVKVNGVRVELGQVEHALMGHGAVKSAVAVAHAGDDRQTYVTAYYEVRADGGELPEAALRAHLAGLLPPAFHPAFYVQMDALPVNLHGKVNRRALPRPAELLYRRHAYVAPAPGEEAELEAVWREVLGLPRVGADHGFAELGGDSLKAIRTLTRIHQRFGVEVPLPRLFPSGTIRGVAALVRDLMREARDAGAERAADAVTGA